MGATPSVPQAPITEEELESLAQTTHYEPEELQQLYMQFINDVPSGVVSKTLFSSFASCIGLSDSMTISLLFDSFDANGDGAITFNEYAKGMSTMTRGTNDEKMQLAFRMYDIDRHGFINADGVTRVLTGLQYQLGTSHVAYGSSTKVSVSQVVQQLFEHSASSRLTYPEFRDFCVTHPSVAKGLALTTFVPPVER